MEKIVSRLHTLLVILQYQFWVRHTLSLPMTVYEVGTQWDHITPLLFEISMWFGASHVIGGLLHICESSPGQT